MRIVYAFLLSLCLVNPVLGHDWYPDKCCGGKDCRPVPCDEVIEQPDGVVKWKDLYFNKAQVYSSEDSRCHVCVHKYPLNTGPVCVFIQQGF